MLFYKKLGAYVSNFYTKRQGKQIYNNTTWYWCPIELVISNDGWKEHQICQQLKLMHLHLAWIV